MRTGPGRRAGPGTGRARRARRQTRAREFGARHPGWTFVIASVLLAGVTAICGYQLGYGTYLGRGWLIAAVAGAVTAAGLAGAMVIHYRRHGGAGRLVTAWLILTLLSVSSIRYPFPLGRYGSVQAFFNVVHAALLGYEAVTCTGFIALFVFMGLALPLRARARGRRAQAGQDAGHAGLPARLRFPGTKPGTWRAGRLVAADGKVTWLSRTGDAEVDLTAACQALPMPPAAARGRQPRTVTLVTADGVAELDIPLRALHAQVTLAARG